MQKFRGRLVCVAAVLLGLAGSAFSAQSSVGHKIETFNLKDFRGKDHSLKELLAQHKGVAVIFLGTECPLAKLYAARMEELSQQFAKKGVVLIGIDSNRQDAVTEMDAFARLNHLTFPILKDVGNKVADQFGATRTPQAFLLDADGTVRYEGRIDDQFTFGAGVGFSQPQLKRKDLAIAVDEVLAGKPVTMATTEFKGCLIGRIREPKKDAPVTYSNQVVRLLNERCVSCHRPGEIGPFAMTKYQEVAGWGEMIAEVVRDQRMPPWHANPAYGHFSNENVLSKAEKETLYAWVEAGCPEGNPAELPPAPKFTEGWLLERKPDSVVYMTKEPVDVKAEGVEPYRFYVADPGFKEDKWVKSAQCLPSNPSVVHHIIVFIAAPDVADKIIENQKRQLEALAQAKASGKSPEQLRAQFRAERMARAKKSKAAAGKPGSKKPAQADEGGQGDISASDLLCGFAPGTRPFLAPDGMAKLVPAGWKFIFQMHYTPNGTAQKDRSSIGLLFVDGNTVKDRLVTTNTANFQFEIPAQAEDYQVEAQKKFAQDTLFIGMYPHMHMRGKAFRYELTYPDGKKEVLLDVPHYDFNWQNWFKLEKPLLIPAGSNLLCTAHFDNSSNNLCNPDPSKPVRWGDQTWEEMMIGWYDVSFPKAEAQKLIDAQHESDRQELQKAIKQMQEKAAKEQAAKQSAENSKPGKNRARKGALEKSEGTGRLSTLGSEFPAGGRPRFR
ncbi:MAG TPA: redoxin domain-containing protein [Planctomycetaceae bacterium]|jgi:peroxiredoxin|nr:redoxin domain-containing protein [Planctomycetaceae bacterium]